MKDVITKVLIIGFAVGAIGVFLYDGLWPSLSNKKTETEQMINNS